MRRVERITGVLFKQRFFLLLFLFSLALKSNLVFAQQPLPSLTAHVNDTVGALSVITREQLENRLDLFEKEKGAQVVVLIINSTQPESIEAYSSRLAEAWKVGRKKIDDGAILVIALTDKRVRIEVAYGLEGIVPDARAKQIIENYILPRFKEGNVDRGVSDGVDALLKTISKEELPPPAVRGEEMGGAFSALMFLFVILLFMAQFSGPGMVYSSHRRRNSIFWGGFGGGLGGGFGGGSRSGGFRGGGGSFGGGGASGSW